MMIKYTKLLLLAFLLASV